VRLDGDLVNAKLVDSDEKHDVALLQVEAIRRPLPVRRFNELEKGQEVFTLGYPLVILQGQEQKATFGRVNALSGLQGDEVFAQIDVPIQPGNSGGPLLTSKGEVAGIVTSMLHPMATYQIAGVLPQNVNYAVKSDHIYSLIASNLREGWNKKVGGGKRKQITALIESLEGSVVLIAAY
jgi:S1-C subfamily serine protease